MAATARHRQWKQPTMQDRSPTCSAELKRHSRAFLKSEVWINLTLFSWQDATQAFVRPFTEVPSVVGLWQNFSCAIVSIRTRTLASLASQKASEEAAVKAATEVKKLHCDNLKTFRETKISQAAYMAIASWPTCLGIILLVPMCFVRHKLGTCWREDFAACCEYPQGSLRLNCCSFLAGAANIKKNVLRVDDVIWLIGKGKKDIGWKRWQLRWPNNWHLLWN